MGLIMKEDYMEQRSIASPPPRIAWEDRSNELFEAKYAKTNEGIELYFKGNLSPELISDRKGMPYQLYIKNENGTWVHDDCQMPAEPVTYNICGDFGKMKGHYEGETFIPQSVSTLVCSSACEVVEKKKSSLLEQLSREFVSRGPALLRHLRNQSINFPLSLN